MHCLTAGSSRPPLLGKSRCAPAPVHTNDAGSATGRHGRRAAGPLEQPEALTLGDRGAQLGLELRAVAVLGQQEVVEARVRRGQVVAVGPRARDDELEMPEAADGRAVAARHERQQLALVRRRERVHHLPEVPHCRAVLAEAVLVSRSLRLQRLEVQHLAAADEQLQLRGAEQLQRRARRQLVEAAREGLVLVLDAVHHQVLDVQLHPLLAVLIRHGDVGAAGFELDGARGAVVLLDDVKGEAHVLLHVALVLEHLAHGLGDRREHLLDVGELHRQPEQLAVHGEREVDVEDDVVVDGEAEQGAHQLELDAGLERVVAEPHQPRLVVLAEHRVLRVEQLAAQHREPLLAHAALVDALLALEAHLERLAQRRRVVRRQLRQRVLDDRLAADREDQVRLLARAREHGTQHRVAELLAHLVLRRDVEDAALGVRVEQGRVAAEREVGAARDGLAGLARADELPRVVVVHQVDLLVHNVVVEGGEGHGVLAVQALAQVVGLRQQLQHLGRDLDGLADYAALEERHSDELLQHAHHVVQRALRDAREPAAQHVAGAAVELGDGRAQRRDLAEQIGVLEARVEQGKEEGPQLRRVVHGARRHVQLRHERLERVRERVARALRRGDHGVELADGLDVNAAVLLGRRRRRPIFFQEADGDAVGVATHASDHGDHLAEHGRRARRLHQLLDARERDALCVGLLGRPRLEQTGRTARAARPAATGASARASATAAPTRTRATGR
mmetsp:Transcript_8322/g.29551  ORF Transcript_8322/g.29551 Transcript_8322/m.29551 type:complete len:734 (-) Transcript_8322:1002-3203(-)